MRNAPLSPRATCLTASQYNTFLPLVLFCPALVQGRTSTRESCRCRPVFLYRGWMLPPLECTVPGAGDGAGWKIRQPCAFRQVKAFMNEVYLGVSFEPVLPLQNSSGEGLSIVLRWQEEKKQLFSGRCRPAAVKLWVRPHTS